MDCLEMSDEPSVFSRSYLQNLHTEQKKNHVNNMIAGVMYHIRAASSSGKTSYFLDTTDYSNQQNQTNPFPPHHSPHMPVFTQLVIPADELVSLVKEKFPECAVSYQETPIDPPAALVDPNASAESAIANSYVGPTVKKGVLIDWS